MTYQFGTYVVGLVPSTAGLCDAQMRAITERLKFIRSTLGSGMKLALRAAAPDLMKPEALSSQVAKRLSYSVDHVLPIDIYRRNATVNASTFLYAQLKDCDEIWCCPSERQGHNSPARAPTLYRFAQEEPVRRVSGILEAAVIARKFKLIPPWVETEKGK